MGVSGSCGSLPQLSAVELHQRLRLPIAWPCQTSQKNEPPLAGHQVSNRHAPAPDVVRRSDCLSGALEDHGVPGNARHTVYHTFSVREPASLGCCVATLAEADE